MPLKESKSIYQALAGGMPVSDIAQRVISGGQLSPQQQQPAPSPASPEALGGGLHSAMIAQPEQPMIMPHTMIGPNGIPMTDEKGMPLSPTPEYLEQYKQRELARRVAQANVQPEVPMAKRSLSNNEKIGESFFSLSGAK